MQLVILDQLGSSHLRLKDVGASMSAKIEQTNTPAPNAVKVSCASLQAVTTLICTSCDRIVVKGHEDGRTEPP